MTSPAPSPRALFVQETRQPERDLDLARAALLIAKEQYPGLVVEQYLARLDLLAEEVKDRLANETAPLVVLEELNRCLFEQNGFRGNSEAYYDPRNSYLNDVLDRRLGIPITLAIVMLEVGWRLRLPLEGVNFPHHFLVRFHGDAIDLLLDPFEGGRVRYEDQAQELVDRAYGGKVRLDETFLRRASKRDILARLLNNLKGVYVAAEDHARTLAVVERMLVLRPDAEEEHRTRAALLARLGRGSEAIGVLRQRLMEIPPGEDAERTRRLMERIERGLDLERTEET